MKSEPRDAERTRQRILVAAQQVFSAKNFSEAGLREITSLAGVNQALVSRYFGSKEKLFEAALRDALKVDYLTDAPKEAFGKTVAAIFTASPAGLNPLPMLVLSTGDERARKIALRLLRSRILKPLSNWFETEDAEERAARVMAISTGFFTYRILLPLPPFSKSLSAGTIEWLEQSLQSIVDAPG